MSTEKLPDWPEKPGRLVHEAFVYHMELAEAALARMEALVEVVNDLIDEKGRPASALMARVNELLASCERGKEAGK